jgi:hypothetical protein
MSGTSWYALWQLAKENGLFPDANATPNKQAFKCLCSSQCKLSDVSNCGSVIRHHYAWSMLNFNTATCITIACSTTIWTTLV